MATWVYRSSVPGMAVPGMAVPGLDGTSGIYQFTGPYPLFYLDYLDAITQETLSVVPGGSYTMLAVNSRAGLTVPPPDNRWLGGGGGFGAHFAVHYHVAMAAARVHTAALHASFAARTGTRPAAGAMLSGTAAQALTAPPAPPSEAALALAAGRTHNARRHALIAQGGDPGGS